MLHDHLRRKIQEINTYGERIFDKNKLTSREKKTITDTYYALFGVKLTIGCGACLIDAWYEFNQLIKNPKTMTEKKFRMQPGKQIQLHGSPDVLTDKNLTDEKALAILRRNPACIEKFTTYPDNWRELAGIGAASPSKPAEGKKGKAAKDADESPSNPPADNGAGSDIDAAAIRRENLEAKDLDDLREIASGLERPEKEWNRLGKAKLVNYLLEHLDA